MSSDDSAVRVEITADDAYEVARLSKVQAQSNEDRIEELEARVKELEQDAAVKLRYDEYQSLQRPEKVRMVQKSILNRARARSGKHEYDYDDIIWGVFDGEPSADHAYRLMELAGQDDGFEYVDRPDTKKVLRCSAKEVRFDGEISGPKNSTPGGGA